MPHLPFKVTRHREEIDVFTDPSRPRTIPAYSQISVNLEASLSITPPIRSHEEAEQELKQQILRSLNGKANELLSRLERMMYCANLLDRPMMEDSQVRDLLAQLRSELPLS